jgi:hypothetical protein
VFNAMIPHPADTLASRKSAAMKQSMKEMLRMNPWYCASILMVRAAGNVVSGCALC